jgi:hypothetical protein
VTDFSELPPVTAPPERLADWLESCALTSPERSVSRAGFIRDLGITGTIDAEQEEGETQMSSVIESVSDDVFQELDERARSCGDEPGGYPFNVTDNLLEVKKGAHESAYVFMALLALMEKESSPIFKAGSKLFEEVCAEAAKRYLGAPHDCVRSVVFGFPRRVLPRGFADAVDLLCQELGEGIRARRSRPGLPDQKDGKLDLVVWRQFYEGRPGKLIGFGQCATGRNWQGKVSELPDPRDWWGLWVDDHPGVPPVKMFFVPHRVDGKNWFQTCVLGGILFDRCRIAQLVQGAPGDLQGRCAEWTARALDGMIP